MIVERAFQSKSRDRVVGYGGGVSLKDIKGPELTKVDLEVQLNATRKENEDLVKALEAMKAENERLKSRQDVVEEQFKSRQDAVEAHMKMLQDMFSHQFNMPFPSNQSELGNC